MHAIDEAGTALKEDRGLKEKPVLVVYVHNLSFEFQFLSGIFDFYAGRRLFYAQSVNRYMQDRAASNTDAATYRAI